ncbi:MAG: WD40 repeat domain-containing protein [Victivallales bacterium]
MQEVNNKIVRLQKNLSSLRENRFLKLIHNAFFALPILAGVPFFALTGQKVYAASEDMGNGFRDYGVVSPISRSRGLVATVDGDGRNVVLLWLHDYRGGYALLMIDAETGKSDQFPMPFRVHRTPFTSLLSSKNKFYTHFGSHFVEFDPVKRAFTFCRKTAPLMAMSMTEDDNGVIWAATYPECGIVSFNPETREFKDYGHVHKERWKQYPRHLAADDTGWIYIGLGNAAAQILAFDPQAGVATPMLPEAERVKGCGYVYRDLDGKAYGRRRKQKGVWYEFYKGKGKKIGKHEHIRKKLVITGTQALFHRRFPDGKILEACSLANRTLSVYDPKTKKTRKTSFDYTSEGAHIMSVAVAPDRTICGGTVFPMRFFNFNPETGKCISRPCFGQWNAVTRQDDRFFVAAYGGGHLLEWNPAKKWVPTRQKNPDSNPLWHAKCHLSIARPHKLLAYPDGKTIIMSGTPGYGYTGGGLFFWNRETGKGTLLKHTEIIPEHSTMSMAVLPGNKLLGGTTVSAGTGGERKAKVAELYIMDMKTKKVEWHAAVLPGARTYTDMCPGPNGLVFGFANDSRFFVFDPVKKKVVHKENTAARFGLTTFQQGPRVFVRSPDGKIYILFRNSIARLNPKTFAITRLAKTPVSISSAGDILDGRIYFAHNSHLCSYAVPDEKAK